MSFPTTGILDTFSDTEGPPMTGWADLISGIKSNGTTALANVDNTSNTSQWTTAFGADAEVYVYITTFGTGYVQIFLLDASLNGYTVRAQASDDTYIVGRIDAGVPTPIALGSHDWSDGDSVGMYVTTGGTVYTYYKTGAGAWTQLNAPIADGTHTGKNYKATLELVQDDTRVDNFGGGDYVAPSGVQEIPRFIMIS